MALLMNPPMKQTIKRYHIYQVDLEPVRGIEYSKRRPALVISDDLMNARLHTVVVCPITSRLHPKWPSRVQTALSEGPAEIAIDQIRTIDKTRLGAHLGTIDPPVAAAVRHVVTEMYGVLSVSLEDDK